MERGLIKTSMGYIHYRATGQGKPIILLHPLPRSSVMFIELMEALRERRRVFAPDYPSYGMSDHVSGHPTIGDYARVVTELMDALGEESSPESYKGLFTFYGFTSFRNAMVTKEHRRRQERKPWQSP